MKVIFALVLFAATALQADTALTIYNQNFGVVRDLIPLDLKEGINNVRFTEITAHMESSSVMLRDPSGRTELRIFEQNYLADPISQSLLLSLYEGKTIDFIVQREDTTETIPGKIIRSGYVAHQSGLQIYGSQYYAQQMAMVGGTASEPIIEIDGKLRFGLPGIPVFPSLTDDTILKPTVYWLIDSTKTAKLTAELSYVTGGMTWQADYNIVAPEQGDLLNLVGWVTMDNQSGKTFENAKIQLVAGDVSKIQPPNGISGGVVGGIAGDARFAVPPVTEKTFDEYHLYTLQRQTTLHDRETKQVEFVRANEIQSKRIYVYDGFRIDPNRYAGWSMLNIRTDHDYGTQSNSKVWVMREFQNSEGNHLGIALPKGKVRFYRRDDAGQLQFVGENVIDHTPRDETIRVYTGDSFDLVGERTRTNFTIDSSGNQADESFSIKVRNHKKESVELRVVEHLYRWVNWRITANSLPFKKTDSQTIEFRMQLKPNEERIVNYSVHYSW